ncbi:MAG: DUF4124 domain-containing protein [Pseudomonadales bacterium]
MPATAFTDQTNANTLHMRLAMSTALLCALICVFASSSVLAGDVYRWKDADGSVHFGEHPPQGTKAELMSTSTGKRSQPSPVTPETSATSNDGEAEPPRAAVAPKPKKDKGICKRAHFNLKTLNERARIRHTDENGEESYLSEEQKESQKNAAKDAIKTYC